MRGGQMKAVLNQMAPVAASVKAIPQPIAPVSMRLPAQTESRFSQAARNRCSPK